MLVWSSDTHAKTTYICAYKRVGVDEIMMQKYVKDGNNISVQNSVGDYKILKDDEGGLLFAVGKIHNLYAHGQIIFINKANWSVRRYIYGLNHPDREHSLTHTNTGRCVTE